MKLLPVVLAAFAVSSYAATTGYKLSAHDTQINEESILFAPEVVEEQPQPEVVVTEVPAEVTAEVTVAAEPQEEVAVPVAVTTVGNEETLFGEPIQEQVTAEVTVAAEPQEEVAVPVAVTTVGNEETLFGEPIQEQVTTEVVAEEFPAEEATEEPEVLEAKPEVVEEVSETTPEVIEEVFEAKPEVIEEVFETKPEVSEEEPEVIEVFYEEPGLEAAPEYYNEEVFETTEEIPAPVGVPGGKTEVDLSTIADDKDIQAILDLGVETLLKTTSDEGNLPSSETPFRITKINKIEKQVVSGINYYADVVLQNSGDLRIYATFTVFRQPWTNTLKVTEGCVKIGRIVKY